MGVLKVDHIGIAVESIAETLKFYQETMNLDLEEIEIVEDQKIRVAILPVGDTRLELMESIDQDAPIAKYIDKKGQGMHHIAFNVEDIDETIGEISQKGIRMIDENPRNGAGGAQIAFCHPKSTSGVLVELSQR